MLYDDPRKIHTKIQFTPFKFVNHMRMSGGFLPDEDGAHACWYFMRCAYSALKSLDDGAELVGEKDHTNMLANLAWSIALMYRLKDPGEMFKYREPVFLEAMRCDLPWDPRLEGISNLDFRRVDN